MGSRAKGRGAVTGLAAVLVLLAAAAASAQPAAASDEARVEARRLGQQAMQAFASEDYPAALALLQRSYELNPVAGTLYNLGMTQRALFDFPAAIDSFHKLLAEAADLPAEQRTQIEQFVQEMDAALVRLTVTVDQPGATVLVDGVEAGTSPLADALRLRAGSHVIEARKDGFIDARETIHTAAGEQQQVTLTLAPRVAARTLLRIVSGTPGATVLVDGSPQGTAPLELETTPGAHEVRVQAPGFAATTVVAQVLEGQANEITAALVPLAETTGSGGEEEDSIVTSWWLWTIVGVVVAGGAVTAGVLLAPSGERATADYTAWMR